MSAERPNTVAGLVAKRAEIAGKIDAAREELKKLIADLDHIDAAIRLFDPITTSARSERSQFIPLKLCGAVTQSD